MLNLQENWGSYLFGGIVIASVSLLMAGAGMAYFTLVPAYTFISFELEDGRGITFSREGIKLESPPDVYETDGFDHIESYVTRMSESTAEFSSILILTPDGLHGGLVWARAGKIEASFNIDIPSDAQREVTIRKFFRDLEIEPTEDYLYQNGAILNSGRAITYPLPETKDAETATLIKRILEELSNITPGEPIEIHYSENE